MLKIHKKKKDMTKIYSFNISAFVGFTVLTDKSYGISLFEVPHPSWYCYIFP